MGKIKKIIGAFVHAPDRFDELARRIMDVSQRADAVSQHVEDVSQRLDGLDEQGVCLSERLDNVGDRFEEIDQQIENTKARISELDIHWFMDQLCDDRELLARLNRGLSISPTIWGDPERLEIDETAAVFTCFFNTNSGRIRIGESAFAGSGVSLLAGTHDPQLTGFMRRDSQVTEGCDIEIGKGVWLASGCTLLGPCSVGDNAVIAAGAVVIPGTTVPENTIWGGVPARQIGVLEDKVMSPENPAVKRAFERSDGMLFADGWGERTSGVFETPGHKMYKQTASLMTDKAEWKLEYRKENITEDTLLLTGPEGEKKLILAGSEGECIVRLPIREGELNEVRLTKDTDENVFMSWSQPGEEKAAEETVEPAGEAKTEQQESSDREENISVTKLDIEKIMEEIRAEARRWAPEEDLPEFGKMPKTDTHKGEKLRAEVRQLTDDYQIPVNYADPSRNPLKRIYKKIMVKAVNCATAPMSVRVTETNLSLKTALEKAVEVIEEQEKRIAELEKKAE